MLPSIIRHHTSRFVGAMEKLSRRHPIDQIIYCSITFGRLLLFVCWGIWFFLSVCFVNGMAKRDDFHPLNQIFFYPAAVMAIVYTWIVSANGALGEMKRWPSRDRLSCLVPLSIKNGSMKEFIWRQVKALPHLGLLGPSDFSRFNSSPPNASLPNSGPSYSPLEILPSLTVYLIFGVFGSFIVHEIFKPFEGIEGDGILPLPILVSLSTLVSWWTLVAWIGYLFPVILEFLGLCFSGLYRERPSFDLNV